MLGPLLAAVAFPSAVLAEAPDWLDAVHVQFGYYKHFSESEDYEGPPILVNGELQHVRNHLFGLSLFNNSFGQFSQYLYYGYRWKLSSLSENLQVKLTGGVLYGYVGEFEDKLAFNHNGFAPALIPGIGWKQDRFAVDLVLLSDRALMLTLGYDIWKR